MVVELMFAKGEVAGPLGLGDALLSVGIALTYLSVVFVVITSERRSEKTLGHQRRGGPKDPAQPGMM